MGVPHQVRGKERLVIDEVRQRYEAGDSLATIGQRFGVDAETVRQAMRDAEIPTRPRNRHAPSSPD